MLRRLNCLVALSLVVACSPDEPDTSVPDAPPPTTDPMRPVPIDSTELGTVGRTSPYQPCAADAECAEGLSCVDILGASVCTVVGCAAGAECPGEAPCVVSDAIAPGGVCANIVGDPFCGRRCRDALACNLDPECSTRGCCGSVDAQGCPDSCRELMQMECEISPQCPVECCGS